MLIRISPEADAELTEAREWYSHHRKDLDLEFMQAIDDALSRVANNPRAFPIVYRTLRRIVVRRFPFAILFEVAVDEVEVVAIFHSRRDPQIWKSRLD